MTVRVDTPSALEIQEGPVAEPEAVKARGYWNLVLIRFRRDKLAVLSLGFIIFLFLSAFIGAPVAAHFLGHGPNTIFLTAIKQAANGPGGPWAHGALAG